MFTDNKFGIFIDELQKEKPFRKIITWINIMIIRKTIELIWRIKLINNKLSGIYIYTLEKWDINIKGRNHFDGQSCINFHLKNVQFYQIILQI